MTESVKKKKKIHGVAGCHESNYKPFYDFLKINNPFGTTRYLAA